MFQACFVPLRISFRRNCWFGNWPSGSVTTGRSVSMFTSIRGRKMPYRKFNLPVG